MVLALRWKICGISDGVTDGRRPKGPVSTYATIVKKRIKRPREAPGAPNVSTRDSMLKCLSHPRVGTEFPTRPGIQSARRPQLNE